MNNIPVLAMSPDEMPRLIGSITFYILVAIVIIWAIKKIRQK